MSDGTRNAWQRFWEAGGWWRPFLLGVVYLAIYLGIGQLTGRVFAGAIDTANPTGSAPSILLGVMLPILLGGIALLIFVRSLGWTRAVFGPQSVRGAGWMWIAVLVVVIPILLRLLATDWSAYSAPVLWSLLALGLCVGFTEELLARGAVVTMLRRGGSSERTIMLVSSAVFSLLHAGNLFSGQDPLTVGVTVVYAFGFGAMMYLVLRVTGTLIWPMLLHTATDPTTILAVGGIDSHGSSTGDSALLGIAGIFNFVYIAFAIIAVFLVKGRAPRE